NFIEVDDESGTYFLNFSDETPFFRRTWHFDDTDAKAAWEVWPNQYYTAANKPNNNTPMIAVIDSGCDMDHPDFRNAGGAGTDVSQGGQLDKSKSVRFRLGDVVVGGSPTDLNGHGTHVAGLALAAANNGGYNGGGTLGTGYGCKGMIINCLEENGSGLDSDVAAAIMWAVDNGADIVSLSVGTEFFNQVMQDAVTYATEKGAVVVCAGNEDGNGGGDLGPIFPAATSGSLGVTANGPDQIFASYAGYGYYVDVAAPGGDFQTVGDIFGGNGYIKIQFDWSTATRYDNYITLNGLAAPPYLLDYSYLAGTSMATPVVSGAIGHYMAKNNLRKGDWSNRKAYRAVQRSAFSENPFGGWGLANGYGSLNMLGLMNDSDERIAEIGGVEGIVYSSGTPTSNVAVRARKWDAATNTLSGVTYSTSTFANGNFRFDGMPAGLYQVWAIANASRKDMWVQVVPGSDFSGADFYCGTPVIDSDGPVVSRCNITASSATGLNVSHWAYDPETRLEDIKFEVLDSSNAVVVPGKRIFFESPIANFAFGTSLANGNYNLRATYTNGEGFTTVVLRPFTIGSATAPLTGTITLQSYSTVNNRNITVQLRNPGTTTVIESHTINVHNGSAFTINTTRRGNYDLAFKGAHFLRSVLPNVNITNAGVSGLNPSLKNGDVDGNNLVATPDYNLFRAAFGSTSASGNWNPMADLDGNGLVGTPDYNILRANFGQLGSN
ncbi:MAG TPA: S8 family serine peptidase, partial [Fimbriimonas sp.]|nr:S8 family serine peptidase [Fimbriimonas sp.]